jgi:hypothetical protein
MHARKVHAFLAHGVKNSHLISQWQENVALQAEFGIAPGTLDFDALRRFAGLSIKVRHNGLRVHFPLTFRLMSIAKLEMDLFASYAEHLAGTERVLAADLGERTQGLIDFIAGWIDAETREHILLWDIMRHEQAIAFLTTVAMSADKQKKRCVQSLAAVGATSVPAIAGSLVLHEMRSNPRAVALELFRRPAKLAQIPLDEKYYCYWMPKAQLNIAILDLDAVSYFSIAAVDGVRSVADIYQVLCGRDDPSDAFLKSFSHLAATGILDF